MAFLRTPRLIFRRNFQAFGLFTLLFLLNAFLVSPFIGWYDEGEMTAVTLCLGISHPSGQALFHLLGKIFLLVPFGTPVFRLGLMSCFFSALAAVLFWVLAGRLAFAFSDSKTVGSEILKKWLPLLTLAWALSRPWWTYSLTPLVYALHLFLALLLLWALGLEKTAKWPLVFFILGMAGVFRPTQWFALPFLGGVYLWEWKKIKWPFLKTSLTTVSAWGLGLSTALYLPLRSALHPTVADGNLTGWVPFVKHLLALRFSKFVGAEGGSGSLLEQMISRYWTGLTPLGVGLVLAGVYFLARNWRKSPPFLWVGLGWGITESAFVLRVPYPTLESHQILLGWAFSGFLAVPVLVFLEKHSLEDLGRRISVGALLVLLILVQLGSLGHLWERRGERGAQDYALDILTVLGPRALYIPTEENEYFPVVGLQQSFGLRPDVEVIEPGGDPKNTGDKIQTCLREGRPLYVTRKWALPPGWAYQALGPLLRVVPAPWKALIQKGPTRPLTAWGGVGLAGVEVSPNPVPAGGIISLSYRWVRSGPSPADGASAWMVLFVDDHGNYWTRDGVWWLQDVHDVPKGFFTSIRPGFTAREDRVLFIPSDFPPGHYHLVVGLQRKSAPKKEGREDESLEFYERNSAQNLEKFMGRAGNGEILQFKPLSSGPGDFFPITRSVSAPLDPRFASVADIEITAPRKEDAGKP